MPLRFLTQLIARRAACTSLAAAAMGPVHALPEPVMAPCTLASAKPALELLERRVRAERLYSAWAKPGCLSYIAERCDQHKVDIAIRERHEGRCPGDPATAPIVDRFQVVRKTGLIQWFDVPNAEYVAFSRVRRARSH